MEAVGTRDRRWSYGRWTWSAGLRWLTGARAKALTGVDDHSRFCISAFLMLRESSQRVCEGLALALRTYGMPGQILTDNGKVFTGRFNQPPVEVLFDRVCRENGIEHLLTQPRSPTTTGQGRAVPPGDPYRVPHRPGLRRPWPHAQAELDEWVADYNTPAAAPSPGHGHPGRNGSTPRNPQRSPRCGPVDHPRRPAAARGDGVWVARRASAVGVVSVSWQQVCLGQAAGGRNIDVWVTDQSSAVLRRRPAAPHPKREHPGEAQEEGASVPGGRRSPNSVTDQPK